MDIQIAAAVSIALNQVKVQSEASNLILKKVLDIQSSSESQLLALVDQSAGVGRNLNALG